MKSRKHFGVAVVALNQHVSLVKSLLVLRIFIRAWLPHFTFTPVAEGTTDCINNVLCLIKERKYFFGKFNSPFPNKLSTPSINAINGKETRENH